MDERLSNGSFFQHFPSGVHSSSPNIPRPSSSSLDRERYLAELLAERTKLAPFLQILPHCERLLHQEIVKLTGFAPTQNFFDSERIDHYNSPLRQSSHHSSGAPMDLEGLPGMQAEEVSILQRMGIFQASSMGWNGSPGVNSIPVVKKIIRLDIPVDKYPNFNFVGRLLGPRGNSLKRVESMTQCRVFIRGQGSVKDSLKEEKLRGKPGYEHLNEPLHVLVEAEFPAEIIDTRLNQAVRVLEDLLKPVEESLDYYKKQQLRELAMLNGTLWDESPHMSPNASPFNSNGGMKRAKTGQ